MPKPFSAVGEWSGAFARSELSERIEVVKWTAVALMLADHLAKFAGIGVPAWWWLGRGAFPLFCLAMGYALSVVPDARGFLRRLVVWGFIAEIAGAWSLTRGLPLNVLFLFALCAWVVHRVRIGPTRWGWVWIGLVSLMCAELTEYGIAGFALVLGCWYFFQRPSAGRLVLMLGLSLLLVYGNKSFVGTAWLAAGALMLMIPAGLPRVRRVFYVVYAAQWPVLLLFGGGVR